MSSSSKLKSKDKKVGKEQKAASKSPGSVNGSSGLSASAYNPLLGTFHTLETPSATSIPSLQVHGRFRNIDETDEHSGSTHGSGADYDSASNHDTRSVESEEPKDKTSNTPLRQEAIPGADNDKREKIRQKNERKHQRQKERRAQELHERCSGYLMSRKLEALAQQLVSMGFSHERATMALILNEGRVEEAVAWLFEGGEETDKHKDQNLDTGINLKIDISDEVARMTEMELKFKCSKQDVERAVVSCEGDIERAEETLRTQKQDGPSSLPKAEEIGDLPIVNNGKISVATNQNSVRPQPKPNGITSIAQRRDEKDLTYSKPAAPTIVSAPKSVPKSSQPATRVQPKLEWARPQQIPNGADKRWAVGGSSPSASYSLASPLQVSPPPAKSEPRYVPVASEFKILHPGSVREPVVMMQRPQSVNAKQPPITSISSSPPGTTAGWYPSTTEMMKPNGLLPHIPTTRSLSPNDLSTNQFYPQAQYRQHQQQLFLPGGAPLDAAAAAARGGGASWSRAGASQTLAPASSLGLFSGLGSTCSSGSTSPVDWNTSGSMPSCDYTNIDWSLDRSFPPSKTNGHWVGLGSLSLPKNKGHQYNPNGSAMGLNPGIRASSSTGLPDGGSATGDASGAGSREWTSPFEGRDLFSLQRHFVSSPSL